MHSYQTNSPPLFKRLIHSQKTFSTELFLLFSITRKPVSANRETGKTRASNPRLMTRCIDTELATGSVDTQDFFFLFEMFHPNEFHLNVGGLPAVNQKNVATSSSCSIIHRLRSSSRICLHMTSPPQCVSTLLFGLTRGRLTVTN